MRIRNVFIDKLLNFSNGFLISQKTKVWNYDEFIYFYYHYVNGNYNCDDYTYKIIYTDVKRLFEFSSLKHQTFVNFIAEGQERNHLMNDQSINIPDFNMLFDECNTIFEYEEFINTNFPKDQGIPGPQYYLPFPSDLCEPYVKKIMKERKKLIRSNIRNWFSFIISLFSLIIFIYKLYCWITKGVRPY